MKGVFYMMFVVLIFSIFMVGGISVPSGKVAKPTPVPTETYSLVSLATPSANPGLQMDQLILNPKTVSCKSGKNLAVNFLLDTSGSMTKNDKLGRLKEAVKSFTANLSSDDVIGVQRFGKEAADVVALETKLVNESTFVQKIDSLAAEGGTKARRGFDLTREKIALGRPRFPDHSWILIFVSDGAPDPGQEPQGVANQIKESNVRIITVGIELGSAPAKADRDKATRIMKEVASAEYDFYDSASASDLQAILESIAASVCK